MLDFLSKGPGQACCLVDRTLTSGALFFDIFVIVATVVFLYAYSRREKRWLGHFAVMGFGVFVFEMFTSPMWYNYNLGEFAYIYQDVSWVLTIGWTTLILSVVLIVDTFYKYHRAWKRFVLYLAIMALVGLVAEAGVLALGVRAYSPEVVSALVGLQLWNVPIEVFYYIPVFSALIIGFYKYWMHILDNRAAVPERKKKWWRNLSISVVAVFLFELMIEPMVVNTNLPSWSYIYQDISIIMTGVWIAVIWVSISLIDSLFVHYSLAERFILYIIPSSILSVILEIVFINQGYRVYGESAVANFSGYSIPVIGGPIEVFFAMPLYLALMIGFIRYWEIILDNRI